MEVLYKRIRDQRCAAITYAVQDHPRIYFTPSAALGHTLPPLPGLQNPKVLAALTPMCYLRKRQRNCERKRFA